MSRTKEQPLTTTDKVLIVHKFLDRWIAGQESNTATSPSSITEPAAYAILQSIINAEKISLSPQQMWSLLALAACEFSARRKSNQ